MKRRCNYPFLIPCCHSGAIPEINLTTQSQVRQRAEYRPNRGRHPSQPSAQPSAGVASCSRPGFPVAAIGNVGGIYLPAYLRDCTVLHDLAGETWASSDAISPNGSEPTSQPALPSSSKRRVHPLVGWCRSPCGRSRNPCTGLRGRCSLVMAQQCS